MPDPEIASLKQMLEPAAEVLAKALDSQTSAVLIVRDDGVIYYANDQCELLFGYDRTEMIGELIELLVPNDVKGKHKEYRDKYWLSPKFRAMGTPASKVRFLRKDGKEVSCEIELAPFQTPFGRYVTETVKVI